MTQINALPLARLDADSCKALKAAASSDENRPILNRVLIRDGFAEATNGHVLVRIPLRDDTGEEFRFPEDMRRNRFLLHRAVLDHVRGSHSLEIDIGSGECWVTGKDEEEGYPLALPDAELETEGQPFPDTDPLMPVPNESYRRVRIGAPVLKAMVAFAGTGKDAGSLVLMVPPEDEEEGQVKTALHFRRGGEKHRTGLVMPMRVDEPKFEHVGGKGPEEEKDPLQLDGFTVTEDGSYRVTDETAVNADGIDPFAIDEDEEE